MKLSLSKIVFPVFAGLLLFACTSKIPEVFRAQQEILKTHSWEKLDNYPMKIGRTDDLHFFSPERGFVINSEGKMFLTEDGGDSWTLKFESDVESFFRCLTFKDSLNGWLGTLGPGDKSLSSEDPNIMYETHDGGETWSVTDIEGPKPGGLCGLQTVSDKVIVGCGRVRGPSYFMKSIDGGESWKSYDLNHLAGSLIAPYFYDENHGILIGGTTRDKIECRSLILETFDGGTTWDTMYVSKQKGEYCWKVSFPTENRGFISIQRNAKDGYSYCLQTEDGGRNWFENVYTDEYYYVQGVGFIDENMGWLGGSTGYTYETRDGGQSWNKVADIGRGFNKFQFFGDTLGYGTGFGVYKLKNPKPLIKSVRKEYFESGKLNSGIYYKNGLKNGSAVYYHENGKVKCRGNYKDNLRTGTWQFFRESGEKSYKIRYRGGVARIAEKSYLNYKGTYRVNEKVTREITVKEGRIFSKHSRSEDTIEIFPISKTEFVYAHDFNTKIEFVTGENGEAIAHLMKSGGKIRRAEKI